MDMEGRRRHDEYHCTRFVICLTARNRQSGHAHCTRFAICLTARNRQHGAHAYNKQTSKSVISAPPHAHAYAPVTCTAPDAASALELCAPPPLVTFCTPPDSAVAFHTHAGWPRRIEDTLHCTHSGTCGLALIMSSCLRPRV
eukprot:676029-Rhodomonas_salina.1